MFNKPSFISLGFRGEDLCCKSCSRLPPRLSQPKLCLWLGLHFYRTSVAASPLVWQAVVVNSGEERTCCRPCWTSDLAGTCGECHSWTGGRLDGRGGWAVDGGPAIHAWPLALVPLTRQLNERRMLGGRGIAGNGGRFCYFSIRKILKICAANCHSGTIFANFPPIYPESEPEVAERFLTNLFNSSCYNRQPTSNNSDPKTLDTPPLMDTHVHVLFVLICECLPAGPRRGGMRGVPRVAPPIPTLFQPIRCWCAGAAECCADRWSGWPGKPAPFSGFSSRQMTGIIS